MAKGGVRVHVYGDYDSKDIKAAMRDLQRLQDQVDGPQQKSFAKLSGAAKAAGVAVAAAAAGMAVAVGKFAMDSISAASDLEESQSKVTTVFGDQANAVLKWAETSATAFGQSKQQALEAAGTYGNLFQAFGLTSSAAQEMSTTMVELAADLASFNNTSIDDAIQALRSGLSGETEPLKRFGIALTDARLKAEALAQGIYNGTGALSAGQKAQAAYAVILQDTTLAQGDFARTSDGLANSQRILQAAVEDAKAAIGVGLVNALDRLMDSMGGAEGMAALIEDAAYQVGLFVEGVALLIPETNDATTAIKKNNDKLDTAAKLYNAAEGGVAGYGLALYYTNGILGIITNPLAAHAKAVQAQALAARQAEAANEAMARVMAGTVKPADHLSSKMSELAVSTDRASNAAQRYVEQTGVQLFQIQAANKTYRDAGVRAQRLAEEQEDLGDAVSSSGSSISSSASSMGQSLKELRKEFRGTFGNETKQIIESISESLQVNLTAAQEKVTSWAQGMTSTIMQGFGLSAGYESALQEDGKVSAAAWIKAVDDQVAQWEWFGNVLNAVRGPGNDPARQALAEYLASEGVDKGGTMGQALIDQGLIDTMAGKMQAVRDQAGLVAQNMVPEYLTAGVDSAQATYDGFKAAVGKGGPVRKALNNLMDNLAAGMKRNVRIDITTVSTQINRVINEIVPGVAGVQARALGGPVKAGSPYLIGERGPELFVPEVSGTVISNADMRSGGGTPVGGGVTLNVYAGMGTDGAEVGRHIVDALKAYERRNGAVYASA